MFEANVRLFEVDEVLLGIETSSSAGGAINAMLVWRGLLDAFVDKVTILVLAP